MTILTLVLIVLALLVGYVLGRTASQPDYSSQLDAIHSAIEELTKSLCGDKGLEKAIEQMNDAGATLDEEMLAYEGGSLTRIEHVVGALSRQTENLAEAKKIPGEPKASKS